MSNLIIMYFL